ncbi:zinc finger protein 182-like [Argiope bruennichi]|uniref:zinc finger protein 182-like n=1 Tax=Argiope bruennichi TaxID=94029 RepID=UPI002493F3CD|nr:zinc finger protein 182-like [Argiope bruennichi]
MSLEDSKPRFLNKDKKDFMDSLECVIRNALSDNDNFSGTANSTVIFLQTGCNEPKNGKVQVSVDVIDEHISPGMHSQGYNNKKNIATGLKEPISTKEDDHAVAGHSGMCPRKKKFPCSLCPKEFKRLDYLVTHYRTHTGEKPYQPKDSNKRNAKYDNDKFAQILNDSSGKSCSGNLPNEIEERKKANNDLISLSDDVMNEIISHETNSWYHCTSEAMAAKTKEPDSSMKVDNPVAGPSGKNPHKRNFVRNFNSKQIPWKSNLGDHYGTYMGEKPLTVKLALPRESNEPKNGKRQVSEGVNEENTLPEVISQGHNKNKKMAKYVKAPFSTKEDDHAVDGPSGFCSG